MKKIGIDIGGTYIKWALFDEDYQIIEKGKKETNAFTSKAKGVIKSVAEICNELEERHYKQIEGVGISMPGVIDSKEKRTLVPLNFIPEAEDINFGEEFSKHSNLRMEIVNDGNAAALGEFTKGSLKDTTDSLLMTLGTGIGAGIIINKKLFYGHNYSAGEVGQHKVNGAKWESIASTRWFVLICNFIKGESELSGEEILKLIETDEELKIEYLNWMENIAIGIANINMILSLEKISIGGGISENPKFNMDLLNELVEKHSVLKFDKPTKLVKAELGNDAGLIGAVKFLEEMIDEDKD